MDCGRWTVGDDRYSPFIPAWQTESMGVGRGRGLSWRLACSAVACHAMDKA